MKNVLSIGSASLSCSVTMLCNYKQGFHFFFTSRFYLHILIPKYLSIVALNVVRL